MVIRSSVWQIAIHVMLNPVFNYDYFSYFWQFPLLVSVSSRVLLINQLARAAFLLLFATNFSPFGWCLMEPVMVWLCLTEPNDVAQSNYSSLAAGVPLSLQQHTFHQPACLQLHTQALQSDAGLPLTLPPRARCVLLITVCNGTLCLWRCVTPLSCFILTCSM